MKNYLSIIVLTLIIFPCFAQATQIINCYVIKISDGDSFTCLTHHKKMLNIRLQEIDAPERYQAFGHQARQQLSQLIFKHHVKLSISGYDRYQRILATVFNQKGENINLKMVQLGIAWAYNQYTHTTQYISAQAKAKQQRIGLWVDPHRISPGEFRKNRFNHNKFKKQLRQQKNRD
mgnify:CR=1 FL=1